MKTSFLILGVLGGLAVSSSAQTNSLPVITNHRTVLVTNWIQPSERYCFINKQLYDKYQSPQFVTVRLPYAARISVDYNGPVDYTTHLQTLTAGWTEGKNAVSVTIKNFPFVRGQWNFHNGSFSMPGGANSQAMLVNDTPSYNGYGVVVSDRKTYDCGTPMTEPYKIVQAYTAEELVALQAREKLAAQKAAANANQGQVNAVKWLQPQATNGDASAQCSLGLHYLNGQGCETNRELAIYWLQKAADQGDVEASNKLAALKP